MTYQEALRVAFDYLMEKYKAEKQVSFFSVKELVETAKQIAQQKV